MAGKGKLRFYTVEAERLQLTAEDLDRLGPGLVFDYQKRAGPRVLLWTE